MSPAENPAPFAPSASEYLLNNFDLNDRIAKLVLNRDLGEPSSALPALRKPQVPSFRLGFATRTRTAQTCM